MALAPLTVQSWRARFAWSATPSIRNATRRRACTCCARARRAGRRSRWCEPIGGWRRSRRRFRSLKGDVGLRPIFHVKPSRIRAHLFVAVLAYHGVHLLRTRLGRAGDPGQLGDDPAQAGGLGAADDVVADGARGLDPLSAGRAARRGSGGVGAGVGRDSRAGPPADDPSGCRPHSRRPPTNNQAACKFCGAITPGVRLQVTPV